MNQQNRHTNCIVLRGDSADDDHALFDQLLARHWHIETTASPHQAFARLCLHERLESARSSWGLERHLPPVLVIDLESRPTLQRELLDACDRYLGGLGVWQWRDGKLSELRQAAPPPQAFPADARSGASAQPAPPAHPQRSYSNGPMLRFHEPPPEHLRSGERAESQSDDDHDDAQPSRDATLSSDEVNMLLGSGEEPTSP